MSALKTKEYFKEIFSTNLKQDAVIDAVRAISVLSIIAFHVVVGIIQLYDFEQAKKYILDMPSILQPLWHGEKGVDAFFLISATVLGLPLFKYLNQFDSKAALTFYKKRFWRIYPLFLFALVLYTAAQWSYFGKYFWSNLFLINNFIEGERTIIPVGWSLLVEVQYYALLPLLFFALKKTKHQMSLLWALIAASFAACTYRLVQNPELYLRPLTDIFLAEDRSQFTTKLGHEFYEANLTRFGPFAVGLLLAYLRINKSEKLKEIFKSKILSVLALIFAALFIVYGSAIPVYHPLSFYYEQFTPEKNFLFLITVRQVFAFGLMLLILGCWYSENTVFKLINRVFHLRFWIPFSRLSFPIYLFHFPFIAVAAVAVFGTTDVKSILSVSFPQGVAIFTLATVLTVIFSIPLYIYIERPLTERGKK